MTKRLSLLFALFLPTLALAGPQDILVKFADSGSAQTARIQAGAQLVQTIDFIESEVWRVEGDPLTACEELRSMPGVIAASPDRRIEVTATPNDSLFGIQWHHYQTTDADIDTPEAWDIWTGAETPIVAVIDTGVKLTAGGHPELNDNLWTNPGEIPDNGIDDDSNGYIDDYQGWDFGGDGVIQDKLPHDNNGHGTHVSGIIGAKGNNTSGVAGVAWTTKMMPLKFTVGAESYGYFTSVINALNYALMMGVKLVNNSWGSTIDDFFIHYAVTQCSNAGMLLVFAAGNEGRDLDCCPTSCNFYPAGWNDVGIVSVGWSYQADRFAGSNYGVNSVDLFAPGTDIWSTLTYTPYYGKKTGTSMAAPQVTGTAALIWSLYPNLTRDEVKQCIMGSVDQIPFMAGKCVTGGRLNVANALAYAATFGAGGGGEQELTTLRPAPRPARHYDVQGRRIEGADRSGVVFSDSLGVTRKRVRVK